MQYYIGCTGWSYSSWQGPFYPKGIENSKWLKYYSKVFNYVEIDSTFYRIPNEFMVKNWYKRTPKNFRFTAKFPKVITHDKRLSDFDGNQLNYFFESILELKEKLLALLIQLPPSIDIVEGLDALRNILPYLDKGFRYAVEVRNRSWFQDLAYNFFRNNQMCMVWSQLADIHTPPIVTTDFVYVRLIGDRSIEEKDFGRIQIDRIKEMKKVARNFRKDPDEGNLSDPIILFNGASDNMDAWDPSFLTSLSSNHTVIVFDSRGIGNTTAGSKPYTMQQLANDTAVCLML